MIGNHESVHGGITSVIKQILGHEWTEEKVDIRFLPSYKGGNNVQKILYFLGAVKEYNSILKKDQPDLVYMHMSHHGSFDRASALRKIAKKHNIPTVVHLHGSEFKKYYDECSDKKRKAISGFFEDCGAVITLGTRWKQYIRSIAPKAKIHVLNNSIHIPKQTVTQDQDEVNVLFLGVLIQRKGVADLLQAVKKLVDGKKLESIRVRFHIGGTGPEEETLKQYVRENHLEDCVEFLGWVDGEKKKKALETNQVFILPSYNEGLPIAILEAISYGMPVIATNVGSIAEAVENEKNGFLFEPGNVQGYADALYRLISDYPLRLSMANASRRKAEKYYDEKNYFVQLSEIFDSVSLRVKHEERT